MENHNSKAVAIPSVYSTTEIARHKNRIRVLESFENDLSDDESVEECNEELDINIRIFEGANPQNKNITGEILCNIQSNSNLHDINARENCGNASPSSFKVFFNANFKDSCSEDLEHRTDKSLINDKLSNNVIDSSHSFSYVTPSDNLENSTFSDPVNPEMVDPNLNVSLEVTNVDYEYDEENDSDMEIINYKSISRKKKSSSTKLRNEHKAKVNNADGKRTMFDLIYYNPPPDPKSHLPEENSNKNEIREDDVNLDLDLDELENDLEPKLESGVGVPQMTIDKNGKIVLDKSSLVIEDSATAKAKEMISKRAVIIENGGGDRGSARRRRSSSKPWSPRETLKFYLLLNTFTTDFTQMAGFFHDRSRNCMKRKFRKEEKLRPELVNKALRANTTFNIDGLKQELELFDKMADKRVEKVKEKSRHKKKNCKGKRKCKEPKHDPGLQKSDDNNVAK